MIYDLIIIGGGPAGYNAAEHASKGGLKTLLIEKQALGGVCLNEGCIPTKAMLYSAKTFDSAKHADDYGVTITGAVMDHGRVIDRKDKIVKNLVNGIKLSLRKAGVDVVFGEGYINYSDNHSYEVQVDKEKYFGSRLLICTGSSTFFPNIPGIESSYANGYLLTNRELLHIRHVPDKLVIIGGGVIGLELASYFNSAGSKVIVIEALDHIAGENDHELTSILQQNLERKGIIFQLSCRVVGICDGKVDYETLDGTRVSIESNKVLLSVGRRPNTENLGLENIGVCLEKGAIVTDENMHTNVSNVYAAGDVNGKSMLAHTGYREGDVAVNTMLGIQDRMFYNTIPTVVYTNPEIGSVGETLATATAKGIDVSEIRLPMQYSGRYVTENEGGNGICKLIVSNNNKTVIGAHLLANTASEFIVSAGMMIGQKMEISEIRKIVFPHPTVSEILREAVLMV